MIYHFAEAAPNANNFMGLWLSLNLIGSVVVSVVSIATFFSNRKQKREVSFSFEPASKDEFMAHVERNEREHENMFKKIGGVERGAAESLDRKLSALQASAETGREKLHNRITEILTAVSEVKGEIKGRDHARSDL